MSSAKKLVTEAPTFQVYTDSELELLKGSTDMMSSALQQRLCQSTMANMITATMSLNVARYPTKQEIQDMASHLAIIYPGVKHEGSHVSVFKRISARLLFN